MKPSGSHDGNSQTPIWQAFSREAALAAEHLATGATLIGNADANHHGIFNQAFFSLSIGVERAAKLAFILDHAITHDGTFPTNDMLKKYCHNLRRLLDKMDEIASQHHEQCDADLALPNTEIHRGIIETLSDFARITRYYNLGYLVGVDAPTMKEPIEAWHDRVGKPILAKHYSNSRRNKDAERADTVDRAVGDTALVHLSSESGDFIGTVEALESNAAQVRVTQRYARMYTLQIARFLAMLISDLRHEAFMKGMTDIPDLSEFFAIFFNDDDYFRSRKTWSIYRV